jgi:hypothetical protein
MEKNKYNNYFIRKSIDELLIELLAMKKDETKLDWYEALKAHLKERDLTENERAQIELFINPDYSEPLSESNEKKLQKENNVIAVSASSTQNSEEAILSIRRELKQLNANYESLIRKNKIIEQQLDKVNIIAAGKAIKGAVYTAIFLIVSMIIGGIIISKLEDMGSVKDAYVYVGGIGFICNLIILERLYVCGDNLENSVIKK